MLFPEAVVLIPTTLSALLMPRPWDILPPRVPISFITPFWYTKAWVSPDLVSDQPTMTPSWLMSVARLFLPPRVPRFFFTPFCQRTARSAPDSSVL